MAMMDRVSNLLKANLNHLLDQAEDPEVMIGQVIRDMDEAVVELRRETVAAVAHEKQLERRLASTGAEADRVEEEARLALDSGDEALARQIVARRIQTLKSRDALESELLGAREAAARLRDDLQEMQSRADAARRHQADLRRRMRSADARLRGQDVSRRSAAALGGASTGPGALDGYAEAVSEAEARAEAARELKDAEEEPRRRIARLREDAAVDAELARLKAGDAAGQ